MSGPARLLALHVLGTDVDVHISGHDSDQLEAALRERWHLCLRDDGPPDDGPPDDGPTADSPTIDHPADDSPTPRVVEATLVDPDPEPDGQASAWTREDNVVRDTDVRRLLQRLTQSVTHTVISARTGELLMLHAAGLSHPATGATAVFVAPGNTGKTTLCRTLGPARAYVSDETIGLHPDGSVEAYPKPLSVRRADWVGVKDETAPGALGLVAPPVRPWLAGIVLLRREEDHEGEPLVEDLDVLDAVISLTPESSGFMRTEAPLQWLASVLERTGGARRVTYAEVADLEPLVAEICAKESPW